MHSSYCVSWGSMPGRVNTKSGAGACRPAGTSGRFELKDRYLPMGGRGVGRGHGGRGGGGYALVLDEGPEEEPPAVSIVPAAARWHRWLCLELQQRPCCCIRCWTV